MTWGCSGSGEESSEEEEAGLSDFEMEHGIGPITEEIEIEELNPERVEEGRQIFERKCASCHKLDEEYVGPPLGGIANARSPAFLMNMMLNPEGMISEHPIGQSLLNEYSVPMTNQNLTQDDARAVTEYLIEESQ
ncbi:MAG: c-type cytochrome [Balneolaceae bacterium]